MYIHTFKYNPTAGPTVRSCSPSCFAPASASRVHPTPQQTIRPISVLVLRFWISEDLTQAES